MPALDIRIHGLIVTKGEKPSIVTSMQYIEGKHPQPRQIGNHMKALGWEEFNDESQTLDYRHPGLRQIIRDAHPHNWVYNSATQMMMPIDISIEEY